jgi:hypothetical protein
MKGCRFRLTSCLVTLGITHDSRARDFYKALAEIGLSPTTAVLHVMICMV